MNIVRLLARFFLDAETAEERGERGEKTRSQKSLGSLRPSAVSASGYFVAVALLVAAPPVQAAPDLAASVRQQLVQAPVLRGEFEQSKQVQGFSKPLISRGSFIVSRERGVLWLTKTPFAS